jgi:hypothetical protein
LHYIRELLEGSRLRSTLIEDTAEELTFKQPGTGARVVIKTVPCSARAGRGLTVSTLIADEFAHWIDETSGPAVADRVYNAVKPNVASFKEDGRILVLSTPWGRSNKFFRLFEQAASEEFEDVLGVHATTAEMNPTLEPAFFESEMAKDPEMFRGEYLAEFLSSGGAFLPWERIEAAVTDDRFELPPVDCKRPVAALDPSFSSDPFGLAIVGRHYEDSRLLQLACARSWRAPRGDEMGFEPVLDEIAALCRYYRVSSVVTDQFCSVPVRQHLAKRGVGVREVTMTATSKTAIYSSLKSKLLAGELELYRHEGLLAELGRVEASYGAGSASIRIPRVGGSHGDLAQALALAVHEQAKGGLGGPPDEDDGPREPNPENFQVTRGILERVF